MGDEMYKNKKRFKWLDWNFIFVITIIMICIMAMFKLSKYGDQLDIKDFFQFVASFGGAILGAIVSFRILSLTVEKQREDFNFQRKIDEDRWKTTVEQFNVGIKIQGINDKINDLNILYNNVLELQKMISNGKDEIVKFTDLHRRSEFRASDDIHLLGHKFSEMLTLLSNINTRVQSFENNEIIVQYEKLEDKFNEIISSEIIINMIDDYKLSEAMEAMGKYYKILMDAY